MVMRRVPVRVQAPPQQPIVFGPPPRGRKRWTLTAPHLAHTWDLTDWSSPVIKLKGAKGLGMPAEPEHRYADAAILDGSRHEGLRTGRGAVFLPVMVRSLGDEDEFIAEHAAFVEDALDPERELVLRCTRPDGHWRELTCRYESGADAELNRDEIAAGYAAYGLNLVAADPFPHRPVEPIRFEYAAGDDFFPGPPFYLAPGVSLARADVTNPGRVPRVSHGLWRAEGPFTGVAVGVGESLLKMTLTKARGQWVEIDMHPDRQSIRDETGADVSGSVDAAAFVPIPPGQTRLVTELAGAGPGTSVELRFDAYYRRFW